MLMLGCLSSSAGHLLHSHWSGCQCKSHFGSISYSLHVPKCAPHPTPPHIRWVANQDFPHGFLFSKATVSAGWYLCSSLPPEFPGWNLKLGPSYMEGKERPKKEADHSQELAGVTWIPNKQGNIQSLQHHDTFSKRWIDFCTTHHPGS